MRREFFICLLLAGITLGGFWPAGRLGFINYDDPDYVTDNANVQAGLTVKGALWALTTTHAGNWHPVTWLSHMLDCQLFGMNASGPHWVNLGLHLATTLLLFLALKDMSGAMWRSAFVAALFACHPLHVQSVAWISERKDLLSGLFAVLTLLAYTRYCRQKSWRWYLAALFFFALGLMSKPMLVTLPLILLLLDFWPLGRVPALSPGGKKGPSRLRNYAGIWRLLIAEKLPFWLLAGASSILTFWAQHKAGYVIPVEALPWQMRISHSAVFYAMYLGKVFWPGNLSVFYPYPRMQPGEIVGAVLLLVCGSVWCIRQARSRPYLCVGWFWFLVMLVPVIGLVQVGLQSIADRYTYLPSIGVFIIAAWALAEAAAVSRVWRAGVALGAAALLAAGMVATRSELGYWRDSVTLFRRAAEVTETNCAVSYLLGAALRASGDLAGAASSYRSALRANPKFDAARMELGNVLFLQKEYAEAAVQFSEILRLNPGHADVHLALGNVLATQGKTADAISAYAAALRLKPDSPAVLNNLAWLLATCPDARIRDGAQAVKYAERACELTHHGKAPLMGTLAAAYAEAGRFDDAILAAQKACQLASESGEADLLKQNQELLALFQKHQPYREAP
jgi:Flp pilus assembly protein TadD